MVQVAICWCCELQSPKADIVKGLVVDAVRLIRVFNQLMNRQGGIIGFNDGVWHFRGRNNAKRVHNTVGVFLTDLWNQKSPHSWARTTSERVCELKSLQTITAFRFFSNNVKYRIYELGAFCVMAFRPVIASTALSCIVKTKRQKKENNER